MEMDPSNPRPKARRVKSRAAAGMPGSYYLQQVQNLAPEELKAALTIGLEDEIAMMRVVIRRVFVAASHTDMDLDSWSDTLGALGTASTRLARLLHIQKELGTTESGMSAALSQALAEVVEEMGLR